VLSILLAHSPKKGPSVPLPVPLPKLSGKSPAEREEIETDFEKNMFFDTLVEPGQTKGKFVFFRLLSDSHPGEKYRLYIPNILDQITQKPKLFFEIEFQ
jgi:hypothetical protein